jgi:SAM-dependent methyltransferase
VAVRDELKPGTMHRSLALFRAFRLEQTEPERFYSLLADDAVRQVGQYAQLPGATFLDVGSGPGYFADAFTKVGSHYVGLDYDLGELSARPGRPGATVAGSGTAIPLRSGAVDICYSSNVLEHVPNPETMAAEMVRVTKPGGTIFLSYTPWLSFWGGHETAPWHYLGGNYAVQRYERAHGKPPKNRFGESLFEVSVSRMLRWVRTQPDISVVRALPRYHPSWAHWVVRIPGLRELAVWNLALVLRVR